MAFLSPEHSYHRCPAHENRGPTAALWHQATHLLGACINEGSQKFWLPRMSRAYKLALSRGPWELQFQLLREHFFFFFRNLKLDYLYTILLSTFKLRLRMTYLHTTKSTTLI